MSHVDESDRRLFQRSEIATLENVPNRGLTFINESGLYALIFGSKLESAREFKRWVTSEVLPSIRKHGAYMTDEIIERTLTDPDYLIRLATELKNERQKRLLAENDAKLKQRQLTEQQPKVEYYDAVTESEGSESFEDVAQTLKSKVLRVPDFGQKKLTEILREMKIIFGKGNNLRAYQEYLNRGYFEAINYPFKDKNGKPHIGHKTLITQRGKQFVVTVVQRYFHDKQNNDMQLSLFDNVKL
jgi:prophage antirepressor-like protein